MRRVFYVITAVLALHFCIIYMYTVSIAQVHLKPGIHWSMSQAEVALAQLVDAKIVHRA